MATTINAANIAIGLDVSKLKEGAGFARGEIGQIARAARDSVSDTDKYNQKMELMNKAHQSGAISAQKLAEIQGHLATKFKQTTVAAAEQNNQQRQTNAGMGAMIGLAQKFLPTMAAGFGARTILTLASDVEQATVAFEVLTGSAAMAGKLIQDMRKLDAESPLGFMDFQQSGKMLLGYGMTAQQVIPTLTALSQVSMGNAEKMKLMALAVGQVNTLGRLQGTELRQLTEHGFNPLESIAKRLNITMAEVMAKMSDGAISADMFNQALQDAVAEGGRFAGMNERMAQTAAGQYAKMVSELQLLGVEMGEKLIPLTIELTGLIRDLAAAGASGSEGDGRTFLGDLGFGLTSLLQLYKGKKTLSDIFDELQAKEDARRTNQSTEEKLAANERELQFNLRINMEAEKAQALFEQKKKFILEEQRLLDEAEAKANAPQDKKAEASKAELDKQQKITDEYTKQKEKLQEQLDIDRLGETRVKRDKRISDGMSAEQADSLALMEKDEATRKELFAAAKERERAKNDELKKTRQEEESALKKTEQDKAQLHKKDMEAAKKLVEQFSTPREKLMEAFAEVDRLKELGMLTDDQAGRAQLGASGDFQKGQNPNNISGTIAPALKAGSVEAYKFLLNRKEDAQIAAERKQMLDVAKQQLEEQKKIAANGNPIGAAR